jgi:hypothetical protein
VPGIPRNFNIYKLNTVILDLLVNILQEEEHRQPVLNDERAGCDEDVRFDRSVMSACGDNA